MHYTKSELEAIRKESRMISRNAGMLYSRILLLFCLFLLFFSLRPTSIYLCAAFAFFPSILSTLLSGNDRFKDSPALESCAKKYFFTYHHYIAEKYTGNIILFALVLWQVILMNQDISVPILQKAPVICMLLYLAVRIISAEVIKRQIDRYYADLECLE